MKRSLIAIALLITIGSSFTSCQKGNLIDNPNVGGANTLVPLPLLLNHLTATLIRSDEQPFAVSSVGSQYVVANYQYYRGNNNYNYGNTSDSYDILKYALKLEQQSSLVNKTGVYYGLSQFFKAYAGIWLTQRVGDIPYSAAGDANNLTPKYDTQHDVYKSALTMLDNANTVISNLVKLTPTLANTKVDVSGDIYGFTYVQWQKLINAYRLRVLISLSKRATDNADLQIPQQFATIISNPTQYPIMTSNADNMVYVYNAAINRYPTFALGFNPYNNFANPGATYVSIAVATKDPRLFVNSTPAPALVTGGKAVGDFTAFVGSDINLAQSALLDNSNKGQYSFSNYSRYYINAGLNAEPFIFIGYPEMCFNIAEAINRGWVTGTASTWYLNGINASLANLGLTQGQALSITFPISSTDVAINPRGLKQGDVWGTATADIATFLANVAYAGNNATGLNQILTQKYMAMVINSGWEPFFNFRRTGVPAFAQGGAGIGTPNLQIPRRWLYPSTEASYNTDNYKAALSSQYGGVDDPTKDSWLTK